uniref:Uncharacterized protein n=1 Tax=Magnetococcus massalia (strain MO-1) TaxID=451514 RepID=A0A1S7LEA5_MAGMO|nr:Protein of unknown function [Candidatus Magnetococcus massalia]
MYSQPILMSDLYLAQTLVSLDVRLSKDSFQLSFMDSAVPITFVRSAKPHGPRLKTDWSLYRAAFQQG